ncbi:MAG: hypothetical protein ACLUAF_13850 [Paraclostridium sordellii]
MRNIKLTIQYDGSRYKGFQRLKDNENTIQGKIESVLSKMTDEKIEINVSGRTDMEYMHIIKLPISRQILIYQ